MTKTWLDRLCKPLEHPKYPQIQNKLVKYDEYDNIVGKCAEGEIACQNNIKIEPRFSRTLTDDQLKEIGLPHDLLSGLPSITIRITGGTKGVDTDDEISDIGVYIWSLNDAGFTYPQIVEFLRTTFEDAV